MEYDILERCGLFYTKYSGILEMGIKPFGNVFKFDTLLLYRK